MQQYAKGTAEYYANFRLPRIRRFFDRFELTFLDYFKSMIKRPNTYKNCNFSLETLLCVEKIFENCVRKIFCLCISYKVKKNSSSCC